jgi:hypothetical protein
LPFEEAREFVWSLGLSGQSLWRLFAKSDKRPYNIPSAPHLVYSENEWKGYGDWCGTGNVASWLKEFINFNDAREFVQKLGLKGESEWRLYCKSGEKPNHIPSSPKNQYPNEWKGFGDWLGTGIIATSHRSYKPFEEAREFVHSLHLKNNIDWINFKKSGKRPINIPATPEKYYKGKGWVSLSDWLGTGEKSWKEKSYLPFNEARYFVHTLNLNNRKEWFEYCETKEKSDRIPKNPQSTYKNKGWISWEDWTGNKKITFIGFEKARDYAHSLNLNNQIEWFAHCKSGNLPKDIPRAPHMVYINEGWITWPDFLGSKGRAGKKKEWREFEKAREFARNLGFKKHSEWRIFASTNAKPKDIPSSANATYAEEGWLGWTDFLGSKGRGSNRKQMRDYDQAKKFVNSLGLKTRDEWQIYSKRDNKPKDIPASPSNYYENYGWTNWGDWLGTGYVSPRERKYLPYVDAKKIVRGLNLESSNQWREYCKGEDRPSNIPSNPNTTYKNDGWIDWSDWLGTKNVSVNKMIYRDFKEVKPRFSIRKKSLFSLSNL